MERKERLDFLMRPIEKVLMVARQLDLQEDDHKFASLASALTFFQIYVSLPRQSRRLFQFRAPHKPDRTFKII